MPSAVIRSFDYRPETRELLVTFTTGRRYCYADVPAEVADQFRQAFSKGIFFNRTIRDRFSCSELEPG